MAYGRGGGSRSNSRGGGRQEYDNTDKGAIFENDRKESESHPDMRGEINIGGREYWISGWWKRPKKGGADFLSVAVQRKDEQRRESHDRSRGRDDRDDRDDDRDRGRGRDRDREDSQRPLARGRDDDRRDRDDRDDRDRDDKREEKKGGFDKKLDDEIPFNWIVAIGIGSLVAAGNFFT